MTSGVLSEYRALVREIELLREQVRGDEDLFGKVKASMNEHPYIAVELPVENMLSEKSRMRIQSRLGIAKAKRDSIEEFIDSINDSNIRQIITHRYIHGLTWNQIAFRMGWCDEQIPRKMAANFLSPKKKKVRKVRK